MRPKVLRRTFLGQLLLTPLAPRLLAQQAAGTAPGISPELWACVPNDLRYVRVPLADSANAWPLWKESFQKLQELDTRLNEGNDLDADAPYPAGELEPIANGCLDSNREALRLFEAGVSRGRMQLPLSPPGKLGDLIVPFELRTFSYLLGLRARRAVQQGDLNAALRDWATLQRASRLVATGEGYFVSWLFAAGCWCKAHAGMSYLARDPRISLDQLLALQALLADPGAVNFFHKAYQVELCVLLLPAVSSLPDQVPVEHLVAAMLDMYPPSESTKDLVPEEQPAVRAARKRGLIQLLSGHPQPLDKVATAKVMAQLFATQLAELARPSGGARAEFPPADVQAVIDAWPPQLWFIEDFAIKPELPALTAGELERARQKLRGLANPVGKVILNDLADISSPSTAMFETSRRAAQLVVALRIHRQLHRKSPAKLDDLVTTGILSELPLDPYAGKPFGYLREKQLIWSVGQSGDNQPQDEDPRGIAEVDIARRQWRFSELPPANQ